MWIGILILVVLEATVIGQGLLAHSNNFLTVAEMQQNGIVQGLPFVWHLGMWGDLFIISPLVAVTVGNYWPQWTLANAAKSAVLAVLSTLALSFLYSLSQTPEAHKIPLVGLLHIFYMAAAMTAFILLYFFTPHPSRLLMTTASMLLIVHLVLGTHIMLGVVARIVDLAWYPDDPLRSPVGWATIAALMLCLLWRTRRIFRGQPLDNGLG